VYLSESPSQCSLSDSQRPPLLSSPLSSRIIENQDKIGYKRGNEGEIKK